MDFKEVFKKYWFVMLIAIALIVFLVMYIINLNKNKPYEVVAKQVDGQYVVYSINDENYYADELYDSIYTNSGAETEFYNLKRMVLNQAYETTDDMKTAASSYAEYVISNNDTETISSYLMQYGYSNGVEDLANYYINYQKETLLMQEFYIANYDTYVKSLVETANPRACYHILIKVADVTESTDEEGNTVYQLNPTEEETAKLNEVLTALETEDFETVAKKYSEDGSAEKGGYLGVIDSYIGENVYVPEFSNAALELENNEVSDVVESQYGYHIIKVREATKEEICADPYFVSELNDYYPNLATIAVGDKATELGIVINDEALTNYIKEAKESEDEEE